MPKNLCRSCSPCATAWTYALTPTNSTAGFSNTCSVPKEEGLHELIKQSGGLEQWYRMRRLFQVSRNLQRRQRYATKASTEMKEVRELDVRQAGPPQLRMYRKLRKQNLKSWDDQGCILDLKWKRKRSRRSRNEEKEVPEYLVSSHVFDWFSLPFDNNLGKRSVLRVIFILLSRLKSSGRSRFELGSGASVFHVITCTSSSFQLTQLARIIETIV